MEAYYEMNIVDPKLSVLMSEDTPDDFLELYSRSIRDGRTSIVTLNYNVVVEGLIRHGRTPEDARNFIPIGCYEPAVAGKEVSHSGATRLYLPCVLARLLKEDREYAIFDELKQAYFDLLQTAVHEMGATQRLNEQAWPYLNPVPLFSGTYANCMKTGRDITAAGAEYNHTGCVISYFADALDSLAAIRNLVFEKKKCTLAAMRQALANDWKGFEKLRLEAQKHCPKWGNNDDSIDRLGVEFAAYLSKIMAAEPNARGGFLFPSLYGQNVVENGRLTPALPNGRFAGTPVSKNMDSCIGMDKKGITALMNSVLKIDMRQFPCGTCLDLMLHPSSVSGGDGGKTIAQLIRTFIRNGGSGLQFNIFDASVLRDAQVHPEKYENLQVRVCGWNVRFTDLEPDAQATFIRQAEMMP